MPKRGGGGTEDGIPADPNQFTEAIQKFRARVPMKREEWDKLNKGQKQFAGTVSEVTLADLITEVFDSLASALEQGTTFETFKADAGAKLVEHWGADKPGRLETIFRTNLLTAYNGGRHAVISAPSVRQFRPYLRFDGIDDDAQTEVCHDNDGTVLAADDPAWENRTPPLHFNCRSVVTPLSADEAADEGIDDEPPDSEPDEGFGSPPPIDGPDWEPDLQDYPEEIRDTLEERLKNGG